MRFWFPYGAKRDKASETPEGGGSGAAVDPPGNPPASETEAGEAEIAPSDPPPPVSESTSQADDVRERVRRARKRVTRQLTELEQRVAALETPPPPPVVAEPKQSGPFAAFDRVIRPWRKP